MKPMKYKIISLLLAGLLLLTGCQPLSPIKTVPEDAFLIVTSFYPIYVSTINITKDIPGVRVINLTPPQTGCLHDYELRPGDIVTLSRAKAFIINGANMEAFMDAVTKQLPQLQLVSASQGIDLVNNQSDGMPNPHVWVSISNTIKQVQNIGSQLEKLDPSHTDLYRSNAAAYIEKLTQQRTRMHEKLDPLPHRDIITFHEAFPYFAKEFNLRISGIIEREPGAEPSADELAQTIELIRSTGTQALFAEPQYPAKSAAIIAQETGTKLYYLDPIVTGPDTADAYLNIMEDNLKILEEALE